MDNFYLDLEKWNRDYCPILYLENMNPYQDLFDHQGAYFRKHLKMSSPSERIKKLKALKRWILNHQKDIQLALHQDFKKPSHEVDHSELMPVVMEIKDAIAHLHTWMRPRKVSTPMSLIGTKTWIHYEPKGRSLILAPWNFPFMLTISPLVSALAAGCTAILKPSEFAQHTTALIERMVAEVFDKGEVAVVQGDHVVAQDLTALPFDHLFFTGSPGVGKLVMKAAAENLTSVTLELGGRNPAIIDASARLSDAARKLIWGKFFNAGQSCMSPNYIMVHDKVYDQFLVEIKKAYEKAFPDHHQNMEHAPDFARVIHDRHRDMLHGVIQESVEAGAKLLVGGDKKEGAYLAPTILTEVEMEHPVLQIETFGPIISIMRYHDLDKAIETIHSIEKPLGLYVFARKRKVINHVISQTSSGTVIVNETTILFAHSGVPFGGVNHSGIGKAHGHAGYLAFTNEKPILRQRTWLPNTLLVQAPYTKFKNRMINLVMRYF